MAHWEYRTVAPWGQHIRFTSGRLQLMLLATVGRLARIRHSNGPTHLHMAARQLPAREKGSRCKVALHLAKSPPICPRR